MYWCLMAIFNANQDFYQIINWIHHVMCDYFSLLLLPSGGPGLQKPEGITHLATTN